MLERARAAGVKTLLAIGSGSSPTERMDAAIPFAEQHDWIYATVGIHPHDANVATEEHFARLDELARHPRVIGWGEMGLDYHYDHSPRDVQQQVFRRQLGQARAAKLPIVIHCRDAWDDCLAILEQDWRPTGLGGIFHCFTATIERGAARNGHGIPDFVRGKRDVPENAASARRGARNSARQVADGDGFAVSASAGAARQAQRARVCG